MLPASLADSTLISIIMERPAQIAVGVASFLIQEHAKNAVGINHRDQDALIAAIQGFAINATIFITGKQVEELTNVGAVQTRAMNAHLHPLLHAAHVSAAILLTQTPVLKITILVVLRVNGVVGSHDVMNARSGTISQRM